MLIIISAARGEVVLFIPACYFFQHAISSSVLFRKQLHASAIAVLYCIRNSRMIIQKIVNKKKKAAKSLPIPANWVILAMTWNWNFQNTKTASTPNLPPSGRKQKLTNFETENHWVCIRYSKFLLENNPQC